MLAGGLVIPRRGAVSKLGDINRSEHVILQSLKDVKVGRRGY